MTSPQPQSCGNRSATAPARPRTADGRSQTQYVQCQLRNRCARPAMRLAWRRSQRRVLMRLGAKPAPGGLAAQRAPAHRFARRRNWRGRLRRLPQLHCKRRRKWKSSPSRPAPAVARLLRCSPWAGWAELQALPRHASVLSRQGSSPPPIFE